LLDVIRFTLGASLKGKDIEYWS